MAGIAMNEHPLEGFDQVRIINLVDRSDRRSEMTTQLRRFGPIPRNVRFFDASRPTERAEFPSVGARGCFESHLAVLSSARDAGVRSLLLLEDDLDFTRSGFARAPALFEELRSSEWSIFHGAHVLPSNGREGLRLLNPEEPVMTTSFVGFSGGVLPQLVEFLDAMLKRPAGSPDFGPMHVDGAYSVFRRLNPNLSCYAAFPTLGKQRSSPSDITPGGLADRWTATRRIASFIRRGRNWLKR